MVQNFNTPQKTRQAVILFLKGSATPVVMYFDNPQAVLTAPETRSSAPVRITRNENLQSSNVSGLYPCGEGAGYAGGIVSAAVDGMTVAEEIISQVNKG